MQRKPFDPLGGPVPLKAKIRKGVEEPTEERQGPPSGFRLSEEDMFQEKYE